MGFLGFLKFLLLCADYLAWPVFALGFPLCASVRAIETGSRHHMKKLVIYWTLFSLLSLFELALVKIIEWIPFWSWIKLIAICSLVVPRFNGACYVYESLVHPCLFLSLQAVMSRFYKAKEDKPVKTKNFLDVAEKYIKENGSEALEQLIAEKQECKKPNGSLSDSPVQEQDRNYAAATLDQLKEFDSAQKDKEMLEPAKKIASNDAKLDDHAQSNTVSPACKKTYAPADVKETTPPEAKAAENRLPETPPPKKIQQEWTCALCLVMTTSEKTLNEHFKGHKHKSQCEKLKTLDKNTAKGNGTSPLTKDKLNKGTSEAVKKVTGAGWQQKPLNKTEKKVKIQLGGDQQSTVPKYDGGAGQTFKHWCHVCNVKLLSEVDLAAHLKGKKHLSAIEKLV